MCSNLEPDARTRQTKSDHAATTRRRAADIFAALLDGSLKIEIVGRYTLATVAEALHALESRRMLGKPLLVIDR